MSVTAAAFRRRRPWSQTKVLQIGSKSRRKSVVIRRPVTHHAIQGSNTKAMSTRCFIRPRTAISTVILAAILACWPGAAPTAFAAGVKPNVYEAVLEEQGRAAPEISTDEMKAILAKGGAIVFDARPKDEYAIAHIPGSINLDEMQLGRFTQTYADRNSAIVVYSDGPFCDLAKSKSDELLRLGYLKVSRYQLGLPVWRILGNAAETTLQGFRQIFRAGNAVIVDARSRAEYSAGTMPTAQSIMAGEASKAKQDRRLRYLDPNTRIVVFANSALEARGVAVEISRNAYPNSSYFGGTYQDLKREKFFLERTPSPYFLDGLTR
jgi:rhodanese-related sulfurtransferase